MTAEQERGVVARITMPRCRVGRSRLTEGETGELDEHELDRDIAAAGGVKQVGVVGDDAAAVLSRNACVEQTGIQAVRVEGGATQGRELEVGLTKGADHAVFRGGTGINRERHTRTGGEVIAIAILLTEVA